MNKKEQLLQDIKISYENKDYLNVINKANNYIEFYEDELVINFVMVMSLIEVQNISLAKKFANNVLFNNKNEKLGYYLLGYVNYAERNFLNSIDYLRLALENGFPPEEIKSTFTDEEFLNAVFSNKKVIIKSGSKGIL